MRYFSLTIIFLITFTVLQNNMLAQKIERFFDYQWKECKPNTARFYRITIKSDSGYYAKTYFVKERSLQMSGKYMDSLCKIKNGTFTFYHANRMLLSSGKYVNDKLEGLWLSYHNNGIIKDSIIFSEGKQVGTSVSWYPNGYKSDSISLMKDESGVGVSWFDNGYLSSVGRYSEGKKQHGKWKYYHKNGQISSIEMYDNSKLIDKHYFDENGIEMSDTTNNYREAQFKGGLEAWNKYLLDNVYFPKGFEIVNGNKAKVVLNFTVNEEGQIENVFIVNPFDKMVDGIAEKVVKKSPKWIPAINHNRRVKCIFNQPINYTNPKNKR